MRRISRLLVLAVLVGSAGCREEVFQPVVSHEMPPLGAAAGFTDITITGLGEPSPTATAHSMVVPGSARAPRQAGVSATAAMCCGRDLNPIAEGDGTIQLDPLSVSTFTSGDRPPAGNGYRYVAATYRVRNATASGTAYTLGRTNLTFVALNMVTSFSGTAISGLRRFNNTPVTAFSPLDILPTGAARLDRGTGELTASRPDVLQAFTETEAATVGTITDVNSVLPYGFVVTNPSTPLNRALPANPGVGQFDGVVTFAYRLPLQADPADDAFTISARFIAVDDNEQWVTRSLEEADSASGGNMWYYAQDLGASKRSLLGATIYSNPATDRLCTLRTGGTDVAPTALVVNQGWDAIVRTPLLAGDLFASGGNFQVSFCAPMGAVTSATLPMTGSQSGRTQSSYSVTGNSVQTPDPNWLPGETIDLTLTPGLLDANGRPLPNPAVLRYRVPPGNTSAGAFAVQSSMGAGNVEPREVAVADFDSDGWLDYVDGGGTNSQRFIEVRLNDHAGGFNTTAYITPAGNAVRSVAVGDMNGDGRPDVIAGVSTGSGDNVHVYLNDGATIAGTFQGPLVYSAGGTYPEPIAIGDFNADGRSDVAVGTFNGVNVLLGTGGGVLAAAVTVGVSFPSDVRIGDVNRDGKLDIVATSSDPNLSVLLGNGAGGFSNAPGSPISTASWFPGSYPNTLDLADIDGDGNLDIIAGNKGYSTIAFRLGDGMGRFPNSLASISSHPYYVNHLITADLDGDGDVDVAYVTEDTIDPHDYISVLLNDGAGAFSSATGSPYDLVNSNPRFLASGDIDHDGDLDLITVTRTGNSIVVRYNQ